MEKLMVRDPATVPRSDLPPLLHQIDADLPRRRVLVGDVDPELIDHLRESTEE